MVEKHQKIAPAALIALKHALSSVYWYKPDLRSFLTHCLDDSSILGRLNWDDYKRNIVSDLVDRLQANEDVHQRTLLRLMIEVGKVNDFSHLEQLDGGNEKAKKAKSAIKALQDQIRGLDKLVDEEAAIERRRKASYEDRMKSDAVTQALDELKQSYIKLVTATNPQKRGFALEKIMKGLFDVFDLDPKASFRVVGEQIDGAFTFDGTDYLCEAKWQEEKIGSTELYSLDGKVARKLDNTLGLYLSINGFSTDGVTAYSSGGRRLLFLMDGSDLMAVLERRIDLKDLLLRKRRAAAQLGNIYLPYREF